MNNNILRTRKVKSRGQITAAAEHNFRTRMQVNIDPTRTHLNQILVNTLNVDTTKASDLQQKLTAYYQSLDIKEKKDNVLMLEFMISASPEFFTGKSPAEVKQWAKEQVKFMQKEFGYQLKIAILHLDEKTPHLHFMVGTELKSVKKYKNQKGEFFKETWSLNAKRYNPIFLRDLHDRHAEHNKNAGYDLKRGVRGSMRTHTSLKEFYDLVDKALGANYDKTIEKTIQSLELGLFTKQVTIAEIREKFKPMVNTMLKQNKALKTKFELDIKKWATSLSVEKDRQELENARITAENEILNKRRELYAEAINKSIQDSLLIQQQQETIARLTDEVKKLTPAKQNKIVEIKQNQTPTPF